MDWKIMLYQINVLMDSSFWLIVFIIGLAGNIKTGV